MQNKQPKTVNITGLKRIKHDPIQVYDIGVEDNHNFFVRPKNSYKSILTHNCHQFTPQAAQNLLKPLEEPPEHTLWILSTTDPQKLPNAILGRCSQVILSPIGSEDIVKRLTVIAKSEKMKFAKEKVLSKIANATGGHVRNAIILLESIGHYLGGLDGKPKGKDLAKAINKVVLTSDALAIDRVATKILLGMYLQKPEVVCRGIADCPTDFTPLMNQLIYLNQYLIDVIVGNTNSKFVWTTASNSKFLKTVDAKAPVMLGNLSFALYIQDILNKTMLDLKQYTVPDRSLLTGKLGNWTASAESAFNYVKKNKRKKK